MRFSCQVAGIWMNFLTTCFMLIDFLHTLGRASIASSVKLDYWHGSSRKSKNLVELSTKSRRILLYLKESNVLPGWWGLNVEQLGRLSQSHAPWAVVFLSGARRVAYLATPHDVQMRAGPVWKQAKDRDFKVHENAELFGLSSLGYSECSDYIIHLLTESSGDGSDPEPRLKRGQRPEGYEALVRGNLDPSHVAEFLVRFPGNKRHVAHLSTSNLRLLDLLAGLTALILAPGDSPQAVASKAIPLVARMIQVLTDEEALVIRTICENATGHSRLSETALLRQVNKTLGARGDKTMPPETLATALTSLAKKNCIEPVGLNSGWRLRELVL